MKKLFREHRGGLGESLLTVIEVNGLPDIQNRLNEVFPDGYLKNICINKRNIDDSRRIGDDWKDTHYVLADFDGYKRQCLGMCNFYEE